MSQDNVQVSNVAFGVALMFFFAALILFAVGGFVQASVTEADSQVTIERIDGTEQADVPSVSFNDLETGEQRVVLEAIRDGSATGVVKSNYLSYTLINGEPIRGGHTGMESALMYTWLETYEGLPVEDNQQKFSIHQSVDGEVYTLAVTDVMYGGAWFNTLHTVKNVLFGLSAVSFVLFVFGFALTPIVDRRKSKNGSTAELMEKNKQA